ncbi:calcium-binding protein [Microvirga sp. TS319]|uniref:calcium-binding protein n=1 Tax=Microvirga sp. TS319 TaxID=3241165 RepID=UPI003519F91C
MARVFGTSRGDLISPTEHSTGVSGIPSATDRNLIFGGSGNDTITGGRGRDEIHAGNGDDTVSGSYFVIGDSDWLFGDGGNDRLFGSSGSDRLFGGNGNDTLVGGDIEFDNGNDFLSGGNGNDVLDGSKGCDTLFGGRGEDTFRFWVGVTGPTNVSTSAPGEGRRDVILDFEDRKDVIDLSNYQNFLSPFLTPGAPKFLGTAQFDDSTGLQVRYDHIGGHTIVQFRSASDPTWNPPIMGEIDLVGVHRLTAHSFILV